MRKRKKIITFILCFVLLLCIVLGIRQCTIYYVLPPDQDMAERLCRKDQESFRIIIDYFMASKDTKIFIDKASYKKDDMKVAGHKIQDKQVLKTLKYFFTIKGYKVIGRNGNTIYFEKWSFGERSIGLAYLIEEDADLWIDALVKSVPLSQSRWYYYETDYGEF